MKKIISVILAIFVSLTCGILSAFADNSSSQEMNVRFTSIPVDFAGYKTYLKAAVVNDRVFISPDWITFFSKNYTKETENKYTVYYDTTQKNEQCFAKRIFIDYSTMEFHIGVYFTNDYLIDMALDGVIVSRIQSFEKYVPGHFYWSAEREIEKLSQSEIYEIVDECFEFKGESNKRFYNNYISLYSGCFSDSFDNITQTKSEYMFPIEEILPLISVQCQFSEDDGILYMTPALLTPMYVLNKHFSECIDRKVWLFDPNEMIGDDFMRVNGYAIDTILNFDIARLDYLANTGRVNDYEILFKDYLVDNEVYLNTFDSSENPLMEYLEIGDSLESITSVYDFLENFSIPAAKFMTTATKFQKITHSALDGIDDIASIPISHVKGITGVMQFASVYFSQVEDHRKMLGAVYDYNDTGEPSYRAADTIQDLYDTNCAHSDAIIEESVRDLLNDTITGKIISAGASTIGPWYAAAAITKFIEPEAVEYIHYCGLMGNMERIANLAHSVANARVADGVFSKNALNNLRLSVMLSLVSSRHAYNIFMYDDKVEKINSILYDLYFAGVWGDFDNKNTYTNLLKKYQKNVKYLNVGDFEAQLFSVALPDIFLDNPLNYTIKYEKSEEEKYIDINSGEEKTAYVIRLTICYRNDQTDEEYFLFNILTSTEESYFESRCPNYRIVGTLHFTQLNVFNKYVAIESVSDVPLEGENAEIIKMYRDMQSAADDVIKSIKGINLYIFKPST